MRHPAVHLVEGSEDCAGSCVCLSASEVSPTPLLDPLHLAHPSTLVWVWSEAHAMLAILLTVPVVLFLL